MLGWEFPPNSVGGLGTHTYEIVKALAKKGVSVDLLLPFKEHYNIDGVEFDFVPVDFFTGSYSTFSGGIRSLVYGNLFSEIKGYTEGALRISATKKFDIIHANDWLTAMAGLEIKRASKKPLVLTMHSTEYDRTAGNPWDVIRKMEKAAIDGADLIIAVSERLKQELISMYSADPAKIRVIYNAIDFTKFGKVNVKRESKLILYVGRLSIQKGVDHLIRAFKIVSENDKDALLYIVGDGPELKSLIDLSISLGLADKVLFLGRVPDEEMEYLYSAASIFVMPSVSEPFGITALEAIASKTPTIISAQSGASEIIKNTIKVNFWDSNYMADTILGLLKYPHAKEIMSSEAYRELSGSTWENRADRFMEAYSTLTGQ